jgi:hypothetical protein
LLDLEQYAADTVRTTLFMPSSTILHVESSIKHLPFFQTIVQRQEMQRRYKKAQ